MAVALAALSGCETTDDDKCPLASALVDTASLTKLQSSRVLYTAQITKVSADCSIEKYERTVSSSLDIDFAAARLSGGGAQTFDAPYFVAVTLGNRIISKREYTAHFAFDAGELVTRFTVSQDSPATRMEKGKSAYDYAVLVGFQLTKEQLEFNRTAGRYPK